MARLKKSGCLIIMAYSVQWSDSCIHFTSADADYCQFWSDVTLKIQIVVMVVIVDM
jgi:hypothetical protein